MMTGGHPGWLVDAEMQKFLPPAKATPFFHALVSAAGKLKSAGAPQRDRPNRGRAESPPSTGAWDFKITLDASDKISGLIGDPARFRPGGRHDGRPAQSHAHAASVSRRVVRRLGRRQRNRSTTTSAVRGQRRAADIIIKGAGDLSHKAAGRRNEDYFVYGKQILAAASGTVVTAIDGVPDNEPGSMNPFVRRRKLPDH